MKPYALLLLVVTLVAGCTTQPPVKIQEATSGNPLPQRDTAPTPEPRFTSEPTDVHDRLTAIHTRLAMLELRSREVSMQSEPDVAGLRSDVWATFDYVNYELSFLPPDIRNPVSTVGLIESFSSDGKTARAPNADQWKHIRTGMTATKVLEILGKPWEASVFTWVYVGGGYINFNREGIAIYIGGAPKN